MTNDLTPTKPQALVASLPPLGLSLINERMGVRMVDDQFRGRHLERVELPPLTREERVAVEHAADVLRVSLSPGRRAALAGMLARLANHRAKERTPQEWQMLFEDYCDDLAEFSDIHLHQAIQEHRKHSNWFPTIAELSTRCRELRERDKWRLERAEKILSEAA